MFATGPIVRYRYRGSEIPTPWVTQPIWRQTPRGARCAETHGGSASGPGKRSGSSPGTAPRAHAADPAPAAHPDRLEEHTSELQSRPQLVCRLLLENKKGH